MTLQRLPPSRPTTPSQKDESPTEKSLDLRVLAEESEWAEYILYGPNKEKLAVHTELFRKKEKIIDGQKIFFHDYKDWFSARELCLRAYGINVECQKELQGWLLKLADDDTGPVPRGVLAQRSKYFEIALRRSKGKIDPLKRILEDIPSILHRSFRRYCYTLARSELEDLLQLVFSQEQNHFEEPLVISILFAADKIGLLDLRETILDTLEKAVSIANAASLWRVADAINAKRLQEICITTLAQPGVLEQAKALDENLFAQLISEAEQAELEALAFITKTNPIAKFGKFSHLAETIAMLRDTLEEKLNRLAAAENRQNIADAERLRLYNLPPDNTVWTRIHYARREADTLRRYVEAAEARFFLFNQIHTLHINETSKEETHQDKNIQFSYFWQTLPDDAAVPAGLELRLTLGGGKKARIPPNWQLRLVVPGQPDTYRRFVDRDTSVQQVLQDVHDQFHLDANTLKLVLLSNNGCATQQPLERHFDAELW
eukprot:CAMPEP_0197340188 /NCGR_PEP_ID=MMETSP0892-20130614/45503_1 /TAXON_ID=44058 ORGANISM="Aureoumbra lagunensis, Strain CCMP1510" /NCGR_SAMPLE_ID=MMETSP0892 /ASSEMBLY_ACC=CAM_ASM_000538 /LENGTH=488 /DNA_ID=CAMNT_0042844857 /DNA_START=85 /DNA_END=1548 /DNA_ORIENTATION=-